MSTKGGLVFTFSLPEGEARPLPTPFNYATACVRVRTFSTMKQVKSTLKTEIE